MEGMARMEDIEPSIRVQANELDETFDLQLKEYILLHYQTDPHVFEDAIREIKNLKHSINTNYHDVETTCILKRYFSQLLMMKNRFPMETGDQIVVPFSWQDQISESSTIITHSDINYELASVMYQIGAVHANIAKQQPRNDEDSIKNAFMHFQYAAFPFQYMRDNMDVLKFNCPDFDKDLLTFYVNILLAQAQECLVEKSVNDHRKSLIVAKLTMYLKELYKSCLNHIDKNLSSVINSKKYKLWTTLCFIKMELYSCVTMLYLGMNAEEESKFGFRLAYYEAAKTHLENMYTAHDKNLFDMRDSLQFLSDVIVGKFDNAKKENDFIYHERVPSTEEIMNNAIEGLCKVKPLGFDPLDPSIGGADIFSTLLPPTVLATVSQYEERKAKLKREIFEEVDGKNEELQLFLIAINAGELGLNDPEGDITVPDILLERNAALASQPDAVPKILERLQSVNERSSHAETKISSLQDRLASIDMPELRSDEGYQAILKEVNRMHEHHLQARTNNGELHKALAAHSANLHLLTLPLTELKSKLSPVISTPGSTTEGSALKKYLDKVDEMQTQRASLVQRLTEELTTDDISKRLLAERDTDCSHVFDKELQKHDQTIKYIRMNLTAQSKILSGLTEANADFADQRRRIQELNTKRSEQIVELVRSFDVYSDVCEKVEEGKKFYEKLLDRVDRLGIAVKGMESAYAEEKQKREGEIRALEEKMKALRAAQETRAALSDFAIGSGSKNLMNAQAPGPALPGQTGAGVGRGRVGDYKEFYRIKMGLPPQAASPVVNPPSNQLSIYNDIHASGGGSTQPPSPAPSSVCDYHFSPIVEMSSPNAFSHVQYQQPHEMGQPRMPIHAIPPNSNLMNPGMPPLQDPRFGAMSRQSSSSSTPSPLPSGPNWAQQHQPQQHQPQQHQPQQQQPQQQHLPQPQSHLPPQSQPQLQHPQQPPQQHQHQPHQTIVPNNFYNQYSQNVPYSMPQMDWRNTYTNHSQQFNGPSPVINQQQPQVVVAPQHIMPNQQPSDVRISHQHHHQDANIVRPSNITQGLSGSHTNYSGPTNVQPQSQASFAPGPSPVPNIHNTSSSGYNQQHPQVPNGHIPSIQLPVLPSQLMQQFPVNSYGSNVMTSQVPISSHSFAASNQSYVQQPPAVSTTAPSIHNHQTVSKTSPLLPTSLQQPPVANIVSSGYQNNPNANSVNLKSYTPPSQNQQTIPNQHIIPQNNPPYSATNTQNVSNVPGTGGQFQQLPKFGNSSHMNQAYSSNPSPWHKNLPQNAQQSPWHGNMMSSNTSTENNQNYNGQINQQQQPYPSQRINPLAAPVQNTSAPQTNLDLLSSLLGPLDSTPAIQPIPAGPTETL